MSIFDLFRRTPAPPPAVVTPAPIPDGYTVLALTSTSRKVRPSDLQHVAPVLEEYAALVRQYWKEVVPLAVRVYPTAQAAPPGAWHAAVQDRLDGVPSEDIGYHTSDGNGKPRILVKSVSGWASVLTHEIAESLVNPAFGEYATILLHGKPTEIAREACDPVSGHTFPLAVGAVTVQCADFLTPEWFATKPTPGAKYDAMALLKGPGQCASGGYVTFPGGRVVRP